MMSKQRGIRAGVRRLFRLPIRRRDIAQPDADEELESFLAERIEDLMRLGMPEEDARVEALRRLGGPLEEVRTALRQSSAQREARLGIRDLLDEVAQDARYVLRGLARRPGFTATALLCLAIGIGANTTMFSVVDALLLRPPAGVRDPASLLWIGAERVNPLAGFSETSGVSYPDYLDFSRSSAFAGAAAYGGAQLRSVGRGTDIREVSTVLVSHQFMSLLGVHPALGRFFAPNDDVPGAASVVVLGYDYWQQQYGGAPDVIGTGLRLGLKLCTVVGVAPRAFNGVDRSKIDLWLPLSVGFSDNRPLTNEYLSDRDHNELIVLARRQSSYSVERIRVELQTLYGHTHPGDRLKTRIIVTSPLSTLAMNTPQQAQNATVSVWLAGMAAVVLLIACANVACLLLVRAMQRRREIAVRLALGVSRLRLMRLLLAEASTLAMVGAVGGLALSFVVERVLRVTLLADIANASILDQRVLGVTLLTMVCTALICGLTPSLLIRRVNLGAVLKSGDRDTGDGRSVLLSTLLVAQVVLTLVLMVGTGLFGRSVRQLDTIDLGFDIQHVLRARAGGGVFTAQRIPNSFFSDLLEGVRRLPGVQQAALSTGGPFGNLGWQPISIPDRRIDQDAAPGFVAVSPNFFETLGIKLIRGRLLTDFDRAGAPLVAVISAAMAREFWPSEDALGRCIKRGGDTMPCTTIVGVVENTRQGNLVQQPIQYEPARSKYYIPLAQMNMRGRRGFFGMVYIRTTKDAAAVVPDVRRLMETLAPDLPYPDVTAFSTALAPQFRPWRVGAVMFAAFGLIALVLSIVGLYGVLAFSVSQRTHEIGVRIALGAQRTDVHRLILRHGLSIALLGVSIGVSVALIGARTINGLLYGISGNDPIVLVSASFSLIVVSLIACYLPARRATQIDPMAALREL